MAVDAERRPVLCVDFDGVLHEYASGDFSKPVLPTDPPVDGAIAWLSDAAETFDIVVCSARASMPDAARQVGEWLIAQGFHNAFTVTATKPSADVYLDDRAWRFDGPGTFPPVQALLDFEPWWKLNPQLPEIAGESAADLAGSLVARAQTMEPAVTGYVASAVDGNGGELVGTEHRIKSDISTTDKILVSSVEKGLDLQAAAGDVKDSLRYAAIFPTDTYGAAVTDALASLHDDGFTTERLRNYWQDDPSGRDAPGTYLAVNAVVAAPNGYRFEIQFHTPDGWQANSANYELYQQSRKSVPERDRIHAQMRANLADVERPPAAPRSLLSAINAAAAPAPTPTVEDHNRVLDAAQARVDELEPKLAAIIERILLRAGEQAAANFTKHVTDHLNASAWDRAERDAIAFEAEDAAAVAAASGNADVSEYATMVCVMPRADEAEAIADPDGDPPEILHVTLAFLGQIDGGLEPVAAALRPVAAQHAPLAGQVGGTGEFPGVALLLPDVPGLVELRTAACEALANAGIDYSRDHGFQPHITTGADPADDLTGSPLHFDNLHIVRGNDENVELPLTGVKPITAAAGDPPDWSAPFPNQLIDVEALVAEILAKTDPVRQEMIKNTMTTALQQAALSWDVTNPLTAQVLASTAEQVTNIAQTTQVNLMKIIGQAYDKGLSIPQTAGLIREGMAEASKTRATMIARTELARAANGGSLAATRLVSDALGATYTKTWQTAPGAKYPRHEDYDGLDGQTVGLDEPFDVGGDPLMYPGDPSGDPGETINCRCSMIYQEPGGGTATSDAEDAPDFADSL